MTAAGLTPAEEALHLMTDDPTDPQTVDYVDFVESYPVPLEREVKTADFPFYALPKPLGEYVYALSESTQTDPGLAGCAVLSALSAALGGFVSVKVRPGYTEPTNIWTLGVASSGERKSSVVRAALNPLHEVERDLHVELGPVLAEQAVQRDIAERAAEKAKRDAGNASDFNTRTKLTAEASTLATQAAQMTVQSQPRLIGDDVTVEALVSHLAEQQGRFALVSAEGGFFTALSGRYSDKTDITPVLKAHAGDRIRVDRKGRDSEFVDDPALTVGIMIQPGILAQATSNRSFADSGLLARFLYSWPVSKVGSRNVDPAPVSTDLTGRYRDALYSLAWDARRAGETRTLTLSAEADTARLTYADEIELELGPGGTLAHMDGWASKVVGAAVRMAGLIHAATERDDNAVSGGAMDAGILLAKYFTTHARRVFDGLSAGAAEQALARQVLALIRRKNMDHFTVRDLMQVAPRSWLPNTETAQGAVDLLDDLGWLHRMKPEPRTGPGRRPAVQYRSHPLIWGAEPAPQNPQNPHNADSVDYVDYVESTKAAPYDDVARCPIHREVIGSTGKCISCITEGAAEKPQVDQGDRGTPAILTNGEAFEPPNYPGHPGHNTLNGACQICSQPILLPDGTGICARRDAAHHAAREETK